MKITSIQDLSAAARGRRLALGLSQAEVAARAGVSRDWVSYFEIGKPTVEIGHVLRLLDALGLNLSLDDEPVGTAPRLNLDTILDDYEKR